MDPFSIGSSIASIILAVVAIALSVFFYSQSKNTEAKVEIALESIKAQSESLQKLTGRWMDRLTRYVTSPSNDRTEGTAHLLAVLRSLPTDIASQLSLPRRDEGADRLFREVVTSYIALYYYTSVANIWTQFALPPIEEFQVNPDRSNLIKQIVDDSYRDFQLVASLLQRLDPQVVAAAPLQDLLQKAININKHYVADTTQVYARRAAEPPNQGPQADG